MKRRHLPWVVVAAILVSPVLVPITGRATGTAVNGPLHTVGNAIYDNANKKVTLRGVARAWLEANPYLDPYSRLNPVDFDAMKTKWNANVVRVFLGEQFWNSNNCDYVPSYASTVDKVVGEITNRGMIAMLSLHAVTRYPCGDKAGGMRMPGYMGAMKFWSEVAMRYKYNPRVVFQLYNEPHDVTWDQWLNGGYLKDNYKVWRAAGMQEMYDAIRGAGAANLVFVSGNYYANAPPPAAYIVHGWNIVYAVQHFTCPKYAPPYCDTPDPYNPAYPGRGLDLWKDFIKYYPTMITEFGWPDPSNGTYNANVISWAESHGIGWIAYSWNMPSGKKSGNSWIIELLDTKPAPYQFGLLGSYEPTFTPTPQGTPVKNGLALNP